MTSCGKPRCQIGGEPHLHTHLGPHPMYDYLTTHKGLREDCAWCGDEEDRCF